MTALDPATAIARGGLPTTYFRNAWLGLDNRLRNRAVSVLDDFGAVGDGVTDDTAAFVAALATLRPVYVPGPLWTFKVATNQLKLSTGQTLFGDGLYCSVIKSFSTSGAIVTVGGQATPQTFMGLRDISIWFDSSVARQSGQRTVRVSNANNFDLYRVDMLNGQVNFSGEDCLVYSLNECLIRNGVIGIDLVPSATYYPQHNLAQFLKCRITGNSSQALRANGSGANEFNEITLAWNQIESNGTNSSGLNVVDLTNLCATGIAPGLILLGNHFEGNRGARDVSAVGANTSAGFVVIGNGFYSTAPATANLSLATGNVYGGGNGLIATGPTNNLALAADTAGTFLGNKIARKSNLGAVVTDVEQYTTPASATLTLAGSTGTGFNTYTANTAKITKHGQDVHVRGSIVATVLDAAMTGNIRIAGLPYTSVNDGVMAGGGALATFDGINVPAGAMNVSVRVGSNVTYADLIYSVDAGASANVVKADLTATVTLIFDFWYEAAS